MRRLSLIAIAPLALAAALPASAAVPAEPPAEAPAEPPAAPPAADAPPPIELTREELEALEAGLNADAAARPPVDDTPPAPHAHGGPVGNSNPDISLILDTALAVFDGPPRQTGAHDPQATGFALQQLEMHIAANADPYFRLEANLVFAEFGVEVEEAYGTTLAMPADLQLRAGQFLTRFGRINASHPHAWSFVDQPLVNGKFFGGEGSRGLGAELSWLAALPWYVELVGSATHASGACCARSFFGADDLGIESPGDLLYTAALKQFFALSNEWSLAWGLSSQHGPNASGNGNRSEIYGTDLFIHYRPAGNADRACVSLQVEALYRTRQVPGGRLEDFGGYGQLVWTIDPNWELGARYEYVAGIDDDPLDPDWGDDRQRTTLQATFYPSHFSRLRLQGSRAAGDETTWAGMLALELLIGAHGAHSF